MGRVLTFALCLVLIVSQAEACSISRSVIVNVPQTLILPGQTITKVEVDCDTDSLLFTVSDPSFAVTEGGEIVAVAPVALEKQGKTFSVRAQDGRGLQSQMEVRLICSKPNRLHKRQYTGQEVLRRVKRRWSPPPIHLLENDNGPYPKVIETIVSDTSSTRTVYYTFTGPGATEHPRDLFTLDRNNGTLTVYRAIDREEYPQFVITARVYDAATEVQTDDPLPVTIYIDDVNDNAPTFTDPLQFTVPELAKKGTVVGKVNATDRDQKGSLHVAIRYSLLTGTDAFAIDPTTGVITTTGQASLLDRETKDKHLVIVQLKDMAGGAKGLVTTGTATITLEDINDNPPTFTKTSYQVKIAENEKEKLLLRIPVEDKDLKDTPNWKSKFVITKGNENGNFRVDTDPKTNEGLLYVTKGLNFENGEKIHLDIQAQNEAELSGTQATWQSIPVEVTVGNVDEGPEFIAPTIRIPVKENTPNGTVIGTYTAVDPETKSGAGISYYKVTDPGSWINVDKNTGELRVANTIDRESELVQDGIYNVTMRAVDASSKTGTGTVIIVVEDANDNVPVLPEQLVLCEKEGELGSMQVVAEDKDQNPFSAPFSFTLHDDDGKWSLTRYNDTAATLKQMKVLPTGIHQVLVGVTDLQGYGRKQTVNVRICKCRNGACIPTDNSVSLGPLAILTMLLPLALLLLLGLLLALFCATKGDKLQIDEVGDSGGILLKSNTEAPGEEVDASLINVPIGGVDSVVKGSVKGSMANPCWTGNKSTSTMGGLGTMDTGMYKSGVVAGDVHEFYSTHYDSQYGAQQFNGGLVSSGVDFDNRYLAAQDSALLQTWQTNGRYLHQKLAYMGNEEDGRYAADAVHAYGYEGVGSTAGSIGCCSDYADSNDLDFLNTLGPKFKTLAGVCTKR